VKVRCGRVYAAAALKGKGGLCPTLAPHPRGKGGKEIKMDDFYCGRCGAFRPDEEHVCPDFFCPVCGASEKDGYWYNWGYSQQPQQECRVCGLQQSWGASKYDPRYDGASPWYKGWEGDGYDEDGWELPVSYEL